MFAKIGAAARLLVLAAATGGASRASGQEPPSEPFAEPAEPRVDYGGGTLRAGAFFVSDLHTSIYCCSSIGRSNASISAEA